MPLASMVRMAWPNDPSLHRTVVYTYPSQPSICVPADCWGSELGISAGSNGMATCEGWQTAERCELLRLTSEPLAETSAADPFLCREMTKAEVAAWGACLRTPTCRKTRTAGSCSRRGRLRACRSRATRWWNCNSRRWPPGRDWGCLSAGSGTLRKFQGPSAGTSRRSAPLQRKCCHSLWYWACWQH